MKYCFRFSLCVIMLLSCIGLHAEKFSDQFGTTFWFKVKDGKAIITSYGDRTDRVRIPATVMDKKSRKFPVVKVDLYNSNFGYPYDTEVIQLEEGIEEVGRRCFMNFPNLYEAYLPESLLSFGEDAFNNGKNISFPYLPEGATAAELNAGTAFFPPPAEPIDPISWENNEVVEEDIENVIVAEERPVGVAGQSDVDKGIPSGGVPREHTFCLIIANEKYTSSDTPDVTWANTDGNTFYKYCRTTLGIPHENIRAVYNADYLTMKKQLNWLKMVANHYGADAKFIVYYAGHGAPDDKGKCYLIPRNGSVNDLTTGFPLSDIYAAISDLEAQQALVLVDACFSGCDRHDVAIPDPNGKHGIARVEEQKISGNVVAITAASNSQTALAYDEKAHGLFTYFVLKALKEHRGNLTYGELYNYVKENVGGKAVLLMDKEQTPSVNPGSLKNTWQDMKL